jgi:hypothetical protein
MTQTHINGSELRGVRFLKISGNTYAHRSEIRSLGAPATWSEAERCWVLNLAGMAQTQRATVAQKTYALGKLGLRFETEN